MSAKPQTKLQIEKFNTISSILTSHGYIITSDINHFCSSVKWKINFTCPYGHNSKIGEGSYLRKQKDGITDYCQTCNKVVNPCEKCLTEDKLTTSTFFLPPSEIPCFCKKHKTSEMYEYGRPYCIECKKDDIFTHANNGIQGETPTLCANHARNSGMNRVYEPRCEICMKNGEDIIAYYGIEKRVRCKEHAEIDMKNLIVKRCNVECCETSATFGYEMYKPLRCEEHKNPDMYNVTKNRCDECVTLNPLETKQASYGYKGSCPTKCVNHALSDMIHLVGGKCIHEDCEKVATYGYWKDKNRISCVVHKDHNMILLDTNYCKECLKSDVFKTALFGEKGSKPYLCHYHSNGMSNIKTPKCKICKYFTVSHSPYICSGCQCILNGEDKKQRVEIFICDYLSNNGINLINDKPISKVYGSYRPDALINCDTHYIIVEIDENQHERYNEFCEISRMLNIQQYLSIPCIFIRFNPHQYVMNNTTYDTPPMEKRIECLKDEICKCSSINMSELGIKVIRMFYDTNTNNVVEDYNIIEKYERIKDEQFNISIPDKSVDTDVVVSSGDDGSNSLILCKGQMHPEGKYIKRKDFFNNASNPKGHHDICKECFNASFAGGVEAYEQKKKERVEKKKLLQSEFKKCKECGEYKKRTTEFFYKDKSLADGLMSLCKPCKETKSREQKEKNKKLL
jgi:hypothetical protein